jgi:hypothetical protein
MSEQCAPSVEAPVERSFLSCTTQVARLLGIDISTLLNGPRAARHVAAAVRKPLLERAELPEEFFAPLLAAAVYEPDPNFCRWFIEPALYVFGRRRVCGGLVDYLGSGTEAERAGAIRSWYWAHLPLRARQRPAYAPTGTRDPALDEARDMVDAWLETSLRIFHDGEDLKTRRRVLLQLPANPGTYPPHLRELLDDTIALARAHGDQNIRHWGTTMAGRRAVD